MKTIFVIPGFKQKHSDSYFRWLVEFLNRKGFKVFRVPIHWNNRTMSDYVLEFKDFYSKHASKENYVLGFSYGAVISFMTAEELRPKKIFLCSLSPDFSEDIKKMKPWVQKFIGKHRVADSKARSGRKIARRLRIPSVIFCGEKEAREYPQLLVRCKETSKLARRSKLVMVPNAPHDIAFPTYAEAIKREF